MNERSSLLLLPPTSPTSSEADDAAPPPPPPPSASLTSSITSRQSQTGDRRRATRNSSCSTRSRQHSLSSSIIETRSILLAPEHHGDAAKAAATLHAVLNLVVSIAGGVGMVTLPGSFALVGWAEGILLLVISGLLAAASLVLLDLCCQSTANVHSSYAGLVAETLGKGGSHALELLTLAYCIGQVIAYLGAIGGQVVAVLSLASIKVSIHQAIVVTAALVMVPLSLLPEQNAMRFAGALGTICMILIVFIVVIGDGQHALQDGVCALAAAPNTAPMAFSNSLVTMLQNAPIFLFSMNAAVTFVPIRYHQKTLFEIANNDLSSPEKDTQRACAILIVASLVMAAFFYLVCSGVAYAAYCHDVPENVVDAWPLSWTPGLLARIFLAVELSVAASGIYIPLGRAAFWHLLHGPHATTPARGCFRLGVTIGIVAAGAIGGVALGGALALPLAVTSALCVTAQMFVLPGLCAWQLSCSRTKAVSLSSSFSSSVAVESSSLSMSQSLKSPQEAAAAPVRLVLPCGPWSALAFALLGGVFGALSLAALFGIL